MNFGLAKDLEHKRQHRQRLAAWPIAEKLAMLDALRERAIAIRPAHSAPGTVVLREGSPPYHAPKKKSE